MSKFISAYTPPISLYPPYINITEEGDEIVVRLRSNPIESSAGEYITARFDKEGFVKFIKETDFV